MALPTRWPIPALLETRSGITDFGAGADTLTNNAAGIITLTGNTSLVGLETFTQNGRINLATFTLTGPAIAFVNNDRHDRHRRHWRGAGGLHHRHQRRHYRS